MQLRREVYSVFNGASLTNPGDLNVVTHRSRADPCGRPGKPQGSPLRTINPRVSYAISP